MTKRNEFGEHENRTPGDRRTPCMAVDSKLCDEKHYNISQLIDHRFEAMEAKTKARDSVVDMRLDSLNHAHSQRLQDRDQYVKKDTYDLRVQHYDKYIEDTRGQHATLVNRVTVIETRSIVWTSVIGVAFTILQVLLHFFPRG